MNIKKSHYYFTSFRKKRLLPEYLGYLFFLNTTGTVYIGLSHIESLPRQMLGYGYRQHLCVLYINGCSFHAAWKLVSIIILGGTDMTSGSNPEPTAEIIVPNKAKRKNLRVLFALTTYSSGTLKISKYMT